MSRISLRRSPQKHVGDLQNPATQLVRIGTFATRSGPDLIWRVHDAQYLQSGQKCSVFMAEKKALDKVMKSRRKELICEILRNEITNLESIKNVRFLQVQHGCLENIEFITFLTEPVSSSLADILNMKKNCPFTELDIIFGVFQLTDALRFLHSTQGMMHGNINPASILVVPQGLWKLSGLNFMERIVDTTKTSPKFTGYSVKLPRVAQPNLDYVAPEAQLYSSMSPLADMFSLGMVLCAIHNDGRSLIESEQNPTVYARKLTEIPNNFAKISERLPKALVEPVRKMISQDVRDRPTSQLFALLKVFNEPTVLCYESLLTLEERSLNQKKEFFNRFSKVVLDYETVIRYERILPMLLRWYHESSELTPFVLPALLTMVHGADRSDYDQYLREPLTSILSSSPKSLETSIVLLDLVEFFVSRLSNSELENYVIPELFTCMEPCTTKTIETVQNAFSVLPSYLTEEQMKRIILPQLCKMFNQTSSTSRLKLCALECIENSLGFYSATTICEDIIPFISMIRPTDPSLLNSVLAIDKYLLSEKKFNISSALIAEKLLPPLMEALTVTTLNLTEFRALMDMLRFMLDSIDRQRTYELILEERKSQGGSCTNISTANSHIRNLPLIAMQRPTLDTEFLSTDLDRTQRSRSSLTGTEYRRSSGSEVANFRNCHRTNLQTQRLRVSGNRSESVLYSLQHRGSLSSTDRIHWNEISSNPTVAYYPHSNTSSRMGGASPFYIPSPLAGALPISRRHSGNLPTRSMINQEPLGSLNVPRPNGRLLDPRRHSYGCSTTASVNSLLTVNVCEGPFVTPLNARLAMHRNSAQSMNQSLNHQSATFKRIIM